MPSAKKIPGNLVYLEDLNQTKQPSSLSIHALVLSLISLRIDVEELFFTFKWNRLDNEVYVVEFDACRCLNKPWRSTTMT